MKWYQDLAYYSREDLIHAPWKNQRMSLQPLPCVFLDVDFSLTLGFLYIPPIDVIPAHLLPNFYQMLLPYFYLT